MTAALIDGKALAASRQAQLTERVQRFKTRHGVVPGLAVLQVGDNPTSQIYVRNKSKAMERTGMRSIEHRLPVSTPPDELLRLLALLNKDDAVDGILVQLPLPPQIDPGAVIDAIHPDKDVDGFHVVNVGRLAAGRPGLVPCTPMGCEMLLRTVRPSLAGEHAIILGRSHIVGRPLAQLLLRDDCTVTIAHSKSRDLPALCRDATVVIAAVGQPGLVRGDWIRPGAVVIDVGINRVPQPDGKARLVGDVAFAEAIEVASAITPVPGGVGPMTIACLLENVFTAACRRRGLDPAQI